MVANPRRFLIFFMHGQRYAFDLACIAEVMDPAATWPIPLAPKCYIGAINFHGAIVAVMDLAAFLVLDRCPELEKIIVLDVNVASLGFLVDHVARIVPDQDIELHEAPDLPFAQALLRLTEGDAIVLNIDAIIKEAEATMNGQ